MNKMFTAIGNGFKKIGFGLKKHSPEILIVTGAVGVVGGAVAACFATPKAEKIISEGKSRLENVDRLVSNNTLPDSEYTIEDAKKDRLVIKIQTGAKVALAYAPAAAIIFGSLGLIFASHSILSKRNAAIGAAYAAVSKGFEEYRSRVKEKYGDDIDNALNLGLKEETIEETVTDENGKEKKVKKTITTTDRNLGGNPYTFIFDAEHSMAFEDDHEYNMMTLRAEQQYANDLLKARGYVYLNDILDRLGLKTCKMGQIVGWVYNPDDMNTDSYVDFGIKEIDISDNGEFAEKKIILDFNVQGNILDLMP